MTPALQASDLDVPQLVEQLNAGIRYLSRTALADSDEAKTFADAGDAILVNEGDFWLFTLSTAKQATCALQSLSAQLAAEKARADKAVCRANDLVNDTVQMGMARDAAEANLLTATKALEEERAEKSRHAEQLDMVEKMVAGTAPLSRWMASIDYSTYAGFEQYLASQLREKLHLKIILDSERDDKEKLADFVDGGVAALEGALGTYRVVMERESAATLRTLPPESKDKGNG
jgi:hypothetical protein